MLYREPIPIVWDQFYKAEANTEFVNMESLFPGENTGFDSCEPLVTTRSSTDQNKTLLYTVYNSQDMEAT